ncbi:hypothetical protein [Luteipulveratus halotolerans]|uniref:Transmembrane protein n=1 Tax=Luteipulveratus halotolerans TaxID=1631356 RepID=A0A0L6CHR8_9MICO|nr:hypothetical protein [Luteipulveratus halotolerans]KNX37264.1 hypothetical protein VV01_09095 [Luteipulveratus halotolerans]
MPDDHDSRTLISPRTGTKVSLLVAIPLLLAAAYFFWVPITLQSPETGSTFNCGTAASPPSSGFQKGTCGDLNKINKFRAIGLGASALLIGGLGAAMFGAERREEVRPRRRHDDEDDDRRDKAATARRTPDDERGSRRASDASDAPHGARRLHDEPAADARRWSEDDNAARGALRDESWRGRRSADLDDERDVAADTEATRGARRLPADDRGWFEDETEVGRRYDAETRAGRHSLGSDELRSRRHSDD